MAQYDILFSGGAVCLAHLSAAVTAEHTELELTGGPLSNIFDSFFRYVPPELLFSGKNYGKKFTDITAFFTRGTKDPVHVPSLPGVSTMPDGRFVLRANGEKDQLSLVRA